MPHDVQYISVACYTQHAQHVSRGAGGHILYSLLRLFSPRTPHTQKGRASWRKPQPARGSGNSIVPLSRSRRRVAIKARDFSGPAHAAPVGGGTPPDPLPERRRAWSAVAPRVLVLVAAHRHRVGRGEPFRSSHVRRWRRPVDGEPPQGRQDQAVSGALIGARLRLVLRGGDCNRRLRVSFRVRVRDGSLGVAGGARGRESGRERRGRGRRRRSL